LSQALVSAVRETDPQVCAAALRLLLLLEECSTLVSTSIGGHWPRRVDRNES
jgi:hypothetical protein